MMVLDGKGHKPKQGIPEVIMPIRVIPRSNKNEVSEVLDDGRIKIRLTAPPLDGRANDALIEFLAEILGVAEWQVTIKKGHTSRDKLVSIQNMDKDKVWQRIIGSTKSVHK